MKTIKVKAAIIRTPAEHDSYGRMTQLALRDHWGDKYAINMALIRWFIERKIEPNVKAELAKLTNEDGFYIGADPRYLCKMLAQAEKELSEVEKAQAICAA